jgi:hypothetical protein
VSGASAVYLGQVMHRRVRPRAHRLAYRVFSLLLDLDEIDGLSVRLRLFSRNRFNLLSFHDRDFGAGTDEPLRAQVERHLAEAGIEPDGGPIRLFAMPRILGYVFNPLSVYFCHRRSGVLAAILYEVSNTFGQRHSYLIPVEAGADGMIRQRCAKRFYVSPFMDMGLEYSFRVLPPGERIALSIGADDAEGRCLTAVVTGERRPLTDRGLLGACLACPLLTLKVIAGIHWEALRIWLKGVGVRERPSPPPSPVTISRSSAP